MASVPMKPSDPAYWMLKDDFVTIPTIFREGCYICEDPEFAQMGLPLCNPCGYCKAEGNTGHVPADDEDCDDCGKSARVWYEENDKQ